MHRQLIHVFKLVRVCKEAYASEMMIFRTCTYFGYFCWYFFTLAYFTELYTFFTSSINVFCS